MFLSKEMQKRPPTFLVTVRSWHCSAAAEGRWGSLTKFGVTESMTVHRVYDGPSCLWRSVVSMTVRPAGSSWSSEKWSQYPDSKSWSVLERRPSMNRCAYDGPSYLPSRVVKRAAEEIAQIWDDRVTSQVKRAAEEKNPCFPTITS